MIKLLHKNLSTLGEALGVRNLAREKDLIKFEQAFQYWRNDGRYHRTYEDVGLEFGVTAPRVCQWAKEYNWKARRDKEIKEIREEIKRKNKDRLQSGIEFYTSGIDDIFADYLSQVLSGQVNRTISDDHMLKLLELSTKIQRGEYAVKDSGKKATGSTATDKTVGALLAQMGKVMMDDRQEE